MPKSIKRKLGARTYRNFSDETLEKALQAIKSGQHNIREASRIYNIPASTLSRKNRGLFSKKFGGQTILTTEEEQSLVDGILAASNWGYPFTIYDIKYIVKNYLDRKGVREPRLTNNLPGRKWVDRFLNEHRRILTKRYCENIKRSRAQVSEETITNYFKELEVSLKDVPSTHVINYDETDFTDDPGKKQVIVKRGVKHSERCIDTSKSSTSVMMAGSAAGVMLPPYVVYRSEHLYDTWKEHRPPGCRYGRTKRGWFDTQTFEDWFNTIVVPFVKRLDDGPKVLVGDNLSSHLSIFVIRECQKHNIRFVFLPQNSTHLCQPLDVAFFRPLKAAWRRALGNWKEKNRGTVPKDIFPSILRTTLESVDANVPTNLKNGFRATGIYGPSEVLKRLPSWIKRDNDNDCWINSLHDVLEKYRYPEEKRQQKRKKRLNGPPGKSATEFLEQENIDPNTLPSTNPEPNEQAKKSSSTGKAANSQKRQSQRMVQKEMNENSDSEESRYSLHDSSSDYNSLADILETEASDFEQLPEKTLDQNYEDLSTSLEIPYDKLLNQYSVGDYLIVKFSFKKASKDCDIFYVGCVQEVLPTDLQPQYYCKFMRKSKDLKCLGTFTFPDVEDLSVIDSQQVIQKLDTPVVRGRYTFNLKGCEKYNLK